jgi:hypothetical protein
VTTPPRLDADRGRGTTTYAQVKHLITSREI